MFDPKCYEIAEYFLPDDASEARKNGFAQGIQDYIELMLFEPVAGCKNIDSVKEEEWRRLLQPEP